MSSDPDHLIAALGERLERGTGFRLHLSVDVAADEVSLQALTHQGTSLGRLRVSYARLASTVRPVWPMVQALLPSMLSDLDRSEGG